MNVERVSLWRLSSTQELRKSLLFLPAPPPYSRSFFLPFQRNVLIHIEKYFTIQKPFCQKHSSIPLSSPSTLDILRNSSSSKQKKKHHKTVRKTFVRLNRGERLILSAILSQPFAEQNKFCVFFLQQIILLIILFVRELPIAQRSSPAPQSMLGREGGNKN